MRPTVFGRALAVAVERGVGVGDWLATLTPLATLAITALLEL